MVTPLLSRSALLVARQVGTAAAPAASKAVGGAIGGTARATILGAGREAASGLKPRAANAELVSRTLTGTLAPRAALPGIVKKTGGEFVESAAADLFSQVTGITAKTSPSIGGTFYEASKGVLALALAPDTLPPRHSSTNAAVARLLEGSHQPATTQLAHPVRNLNSSAIDATAIGGAHLLAHLIATKNGS
jgi:hypothetical protein